MALFLDPSRRRRIAVLAVPIVFVSTGFGVLSVTVSPASADTPAVSPCQPYQVPGLPGPGGGEIIAMNDTGMYVGQAIDASGGRHASWWTHAGPDLSTGWTL